MAASDQVVSSSATANPGTPNKPGLLTRLSFGIGGAADGIKDNGFEYFLLLYYSAILGLPSTLVASALLIALVIDAVSDPIVGYWSDNLRTRYGRRHPFMYAVVIPIAIAYFMVWNPPAGMAGHALFYWLLGCTVLVRLLFTFYSVPGTALAAELTDDYDTRTSLMSFRYFFAWIGGLSVQIVLLWFLLKPSESNPSGFFSLPGWRTYGLLGSGLIALAVLVCAAGTHSRIPYLKPPPPQRTLTLGTIFREIFETVSAPSFRALFLATLFGLLAGGISAGLNQYINGFFWDFKTPQIAVLTISVFISSFLAVVVAPVIGRLFGKKRGAMVIGILAFTIAPLPVFLRLMGVLPPNGTEALFNIILFITIFDLSLIIATQMLLGSMVADIAEESELKTGRRSEGIFFAGISFIRKLSQGAGLMVAAVVLGVARIAPGMQPGDVPDASLRLLGWGYALTLLTMWMLMMLCVSFYRISRESHESNLTALAARNAAPPAP